MVDVALGVLGVERVDHLVHPEHAERRDVQHLGLAPLEEPRPVRPGDQPDLRGEVADLVGPPAVQPDALADHALAHRVLLQLLERR